MLVTGFHVNDSSGLTNWKAFLRIQPMPKCSRTLSKFSSVQSSLYGLLRNGRRLFELSARQWGETAMAAEVITRIVRIILIFVSMVVTEIVANKKT